MTLAGTRKHLNNVHCHVPARRTDVRAKEHRHICGANAYHYMTSNHDLRGPSAMRAGSKQGGGKHADADTAWHGQTHACMVLHVISTCNEIAGKSSLRSICSVRNAAVDSPGPEGQRRASPHECVVQQQEGRHHGVHNPCNRDRQRGDDAGAGDQLAQAHPQRHR